MAMAVFIPGHSTTGDITGFASACGTTSNDAAFYACFDWDNCYAPPVAPKDETAQTRRRAFIESFLAAGHRRSLLMARCATGKARIRRDRVWRPPRAG